MDTRLPLDIIENFILPQLSETNLILVENAFPSLSSKIRKILDSRLKAISYENETFLFTLHEINPSPHLSSKSGQMITFIDPYFPRVLLYKVFDGTLLAEATFNNPGRAVKVQFNISEDFIIVFTEFGTTIFSILQELDEDVNHVSLKKFMSVNFNPSYSTVPRIYGEPETISSKVMCEISTKTYGIVRASYSYIPHSNRQALVRLDVMSGDVNSEPELNEANLDFCDIPFLTKHISSDSFITMALIQKVPEVLNSVHCTTLFLRSTLLMQLGNAELILDPLRICFSSSGETPFVLLVNPLMTDDGPWSKIFIESEHKEMYKYTISSRYSAFTVAWKVAGGVSAERYHSRDGSLRSSVFLPVPAELQVLDFLESSDGKLCIALFGMGNETKAQVHGWSVGDINRQGVVTVSLQQQLITSASQSNDIGPCNYFYRNFDISNNGQLLLALMYNGHEEIPNKIVIFLVATGEIVITTEMYFIEQFIQDPFWNFDIESVRKSFQVSFLKYVSNQFTFTARFGRVIQIGTTRIGE